MSYQHPDILRVFTYDLECNHQFIAVYHRHGDSLGHREIGDFCWCLECHVRQMVTRVTPTIIDRSPEKVVHLGTAGGPARHRHNGNGNGNGNKRHHRYPVKRVQTPRLPVGA